MAGNAYPSGEPYESFANAIIIQAAIDYRAALNKIRKNPSNRNSIYEALRIENFFRSVWFQQLTDVDGESLIRKLRKQTKKRRTVLNSTLHSD